MEKILNIEEVWIVLVGYYREFEGAFSSYDLAMEYCKENDIREEEILKVEVDVGRSLG